MVVSSYGPNAGSSRVRLHDWINHLDLRADVESYVDTSNNSPRTLTKHPTALLAAEVRLRQTNPTRYGSIVISRQASPFSTGRVEARLLKGATTGVYDFDDALYLGKASGSLGTVFPKARIWRRSVAAADVVIAGNETLAGAASEFSTSVVVIPSCVDHRAYVLKDQYPLANPPRAVWIGSPATECYLRSIERPLLEAHRTFGLRVKLISGGPRTLGALDVMVDRVPWRIDTFTHELADADFGIMPLSDTPWSRGKCAYKLLQYGASGLPLLGDPVGANAFVLREGRGLAPTSEDEWHDAIEQLLNESAEERRSRGSAARALVAEAFSFEAWAPAWRAAVGL